MKCHAYWHLQTASDHPHPISVTVALGIGERVNLAGIHRTDEHRAFRTQRNLACIRHLVRIHRDVETLRQGEFVELGRSENGRSEKNQQQ